MWIRIDGVEANGSYWKNGHADLNELGSGNITLLWDTEAEAPYAHVYWWFDKEYSAKELGFENPKEEVEYPEYLEIENEGTEEEAYRYPVVASLEIVNGWAQLGEWSYEGKEAEEILQEAVELPIYVYAMYEKGEGWKLQKYDPRIGGYRDITADELKKAFHSRRLGHHKKREGGPARRYRDLED